MKRILIVEDAEDVAEILRAALHDFDLRIVTTVKDALACLAGEGFDVLLLDVSLPDGSGFEVLSKVEQSSPGLPVFCVTGSADFASKVSAFSLGADDFIQKPFDPSELRLRIEAKLRKRIRLEQERDVMQVGDLVCNLTEQRLRREREVIDLTSHEFRIFRLLARRPSRIFSREEILSRVWTNSVSVTDRTVDVHISNLRRKLRGSRAKIFAVIGSGYRLEVLA